MAEKSIPDQIVDDFLQKLASQQILEPEKLHALKSVLNSAKPKKVDILKAMMGDQ